MRLGVTKASETAATHGGSDSLRNSPLRALRACVSDNCVFAHKPLTTRLRLIGRHWRLHHVVGLGAPAWVLLILRVVCHPRARAAVSSKVDGREKRPAGEYSTPMDLGAFNSQSFDANEYANGLIAPVGKDDITAALAKLNFGIDDVANQLKNLVTEHHHALLAQAAGIGDLEGSISSVRLGLDEVTSSLEKCARLRPTDARARSRCRTQTAPKDSRAVPVTGFTRPPSTPSTTGDRRPQAYRAFRHSRSQTARPDARHGQGTCGRHLLRTESLVHSRRGQLRGRQELWY